MAHMDDPIDVAVDAVVIGGGPAGSSTGRLLAEWGHDVLILTKPADPRRGLAESLPPSTRKVLASVGVLETVDAAGFCRTTGNTVWWGARKGCNGNFADAECTHGYQVFRPTVTLEAVRDSHDQPARDRGRTRVVPGGSLCSREV
jgi:2-polyprenyl-6-methoxyphenol hydroxylase-like FAD-dependent oxidoreductase